MFDDVQILSYDESVTLLSQYANNKGEFWENYVRNYDCKIKYHDDAIDIFVDTDDFALAYYINSHRINDSHKLFLKMKWNF